MNQQETEFLLDWLDKTPTLEGPVVDSLFERLSAFLEDGFLDANESAALFDMLNEFVGSSSDDSAFEKTWMPVDETQPPVQFEGNQFMFTGVFVLEGRKWLEEQVEALGGKHVKGSYVSKKLNYLVIGTKASDQYKHGTFGDKIDRAVRHREEYGTPAIIGEGHFLRCLNDQLAASPLQDG